MDGVDWTEAIGVAIDSCAAIVCVIDPKFISSTFCLDELAMAKSNGLSIFPLIFGTLQKRKQVDNVLSKTFYPDSEHQLLLVLLVRSDSHSDSAC